MKIMDRDTHWFWRLIFRGGSYRVTGIADTITESIAWNRENNINEHYTFKFHNVNGIIMETLDISFFTKRSAMAYKLAWVTD